MGTGNTSPWIEIFATGTWHGVPYVEADLDTMAENFTRDAATIEPPMVVGHDEDQDVLNDSGLPNAGLLSAMKRVGSKLLAKFKDIPKLISKVVGKGSYSRCSVEIHPNFRGNGLTVRRVALLGGELPEVNTLQKIAALSTDEDNITINFSAGDIKMGDMVKTTETKTTETPAPVAAPAAEPTIDNEEGEEGAVDAAALAQAVADMQVVQGEIMARLEALEGGEAPEMAEDDEEEEEVPVAASADNAEVAKLSAEVADMKADSHLHTVEALCSELSQDGKHTPAALESMKGTMVKMSAADLSVLATELRGAPVRTGEQGKGGEPVKATKTETDEEKVIRFGAEWDGMDKGYQRFCSRAAHIEEAMDTTVFVAKEE